MTEKNKKRTPRSYSDEFKQQLMALYRNGKRKCDKSQHPQILGISNV